MDKLYNELITTVKDSKDYYLIHESIWRSIEKLDIQLKSHYFDLENIQYLWQLGML